MDGWLINAACKGISQNDYKWAGKSEEDEGRNQPMIRYQLKLLIKMKK